MPVTAPVAPLTPEEIENLAPDYFGPTWEHEDGGHGPNPCSARCATPLGMPRFILPEFTLGWKVIEWCTEYLNSLDTSVDPDHPEPWQFTMEQVRFILWWYGVDYDGKFIYRTGVLQRLKGWGKDPLASVLCAVEFVGPSQFAGWNGSDPKCRPHPRSWVQVAAVSRDQTRNTMTLFPALISQKCIEHYGITIGAELIRAHRGRCRLEAVTSSYRALEGGRSTFVILNETHHWIRGNNGDKMYDTVDGNTTKMNCRYLAITNAYLPGEDSVAEKMRFNFDLQREGRAEMTGMLYDSIEAHPRTPLNRMALEIVIPKIRGDAVWLNIDAIASSVASTTISAARSRRMWLNQIVSDEDAVFGKDDLKLITVNEAVLKQGDAIVMGFDGSRYEDSTALVIIRVKDHMTFLIDIWEKPHTWNEEARGRWEVPVEEVNSRVRQCFRDYKVLAFFADVNLWESYISDWSLDYGSGLKVKSTQHSPIGWDMRQAEQQRTRAHQRFYQKIKDRKIFYDGDLTLTRHSMNARRDENKYGTYFRKESQDSTRKIDAYAAWFLAAEALDRYETGGVGAEEEGKQKKSGGWFM